MKSYYLFCLIILITLLIGCTREKKTDLEGVWQLVSGEYTLKDTTATLPSSDYLKSYLFMGKTYFSVITQDTSQQLFFVNGGTYNIDGENYTQNIEICNNRKTIGKSNTWKYQLEGEQFTMSSDWLHEVWKKIE